MVCTKKVHESRRSDVERMHTFPRRVRMHAAQVLGDQRAHGGMLQVVEFDRQRHAGVPSVICQ